MTMNTAILDTMTRAYLACALWSSTDNANESGGDPLDDNYSIDDFAPSTIAQAIADCEEFTCANIGDVDLWTREFGSTEQAGHDFWLTRNGHGAGFWDRFSHGHELYPVGRRLTDAAKVYGSCDVYVGDDGKLYFA